MISITCSILYEPFCDEILIAQRRLKDFVLKTAARCRCVRTKVLSKFLCCIVLVIM